MICYSLLLTTISLVIPIVAIFYLFILSKLAIDHDKCYPKTALSIIFIIIIVIIFAICRSSNEEIDIWQYGKEENIRRQIKESKEKIISNETVMMDKQYEIFRLEDKITRLIEEL